MTSCAVNESFLTPSFSTLKITNKSVNDETVQVSKNLALIKIDKNKSVKLKLKSGIYNIQLSSKEEVITVNLKAGVIYKYTIN